ncbi:MAG: hypothetical protein ACWGQW_25860, partial [bacterium]
ITRKGGKIYGIKSSNTKSSTDLEDWVYGDFLKDEADLLLGDVIGIGWAVVGDLRKRIGGHKVRSVDSRSKANDETRFYNKRAQMFWQLREAFERKEISLKALDDSDYSELSNQLGAITYSTETGRIQIVKKAKIKDEIGHSPDEADALAISYALPQQSTRKILDDYDDDPDYRKRREYVTTGTRNGWMTA